MDECKPVAPGSLMQRRSFPPALWLPGGVEQTSDPGMIRMLREPSFNVVRAGAYTRSRQSST